MVEQNFGSYLAAERKRAGYTLRKLATKAKSSTSSLSRWENNHIVPVRDDVMKLDWALGLEGVLFRKWEALTAPNALLPWMRDAGRLEEEARAITYISPALVPGLLQSPAYSEMIFREGQPLWSREEIARVVALRCRRFEFLRERNDPSITAVFPSITLTMVPEATRKEQAQRLLKLLDEGVRIHLLPPTEVMMGVTSPLLLARLEDGTRAASSDHQNGNVIFDESGGLERLFEIERRALGTVFWKWEQSKACSGRLGERARTP
ncbi:Scr1 family TA system antitoxin-like transcriptional regulator [Nocardiopsis aegyptia]|uniref:helix-turn-helix domain-containing protein n=1 Tax=Nocardiopsis aegyptia TaxID=220378 RepID=UPI003672A7A5